MTDEPLVLCGREFEAFTRALDRQFAAAPGLRARHELIEISALERLVVDGEGTTDGGVDVFLLNTDWLPNLIAQDRLLPLDDRLAAAPPDGWPEAWVGSLRELQTGPDGRVYGVAYHDGPVMLLYRTDLYRDPAEQRGFAERFGYPLAPARTWDELLDQAAWFTRPEQRLWGTVLAGYPDAHNNVYDFLTQLWLRDADLLTASGESALDTPAAREALAFLDDLWHARGVIDPAAREWDSVASGVHFAAGEAAMMVNWCGFASLSADPGSPTHGRIGCAPIPAGPTGTRATMNSYWVLAIPTGCRRPDEAWGLIRHLASPEMDAITAAEGATACRRDSWARADVRALAPYYAELEPAHRDARAIPRDPRWPAIAAVLDAMMADLVAGRAGPGGRTALQKAHVRLTGVLAA
ncbi:MAG TPA: extracellular solute-binding protein [Solirubrobacteraceae bacterium]|nr:extracellular solute-binding protein [Solirubrobacteraceae bacterium]